MSLLYYCFIVTNVMEDVGLLDTVIEVNLDFLYAVFGTITY